MLTLKNIVKNYTVGDTEVPALKQVSIAFRQNEFVSILGPSGCGKTTLLNIIGGLDNYTSGDLFINGKSTKQFSARDWDTYRNHSVGFVFQSYNLIPHQSVLSNVELALTLSGVSKAERRARAIEALEKVGLKDQIHKKPNQMSGGQMQRVAIARALVNDPDILLADEPTGALDSATSIQVMEILKEISKDRLIIMVTHNPELAETYSSRIIRLLDGEVQSDSDPFDGAPPEDRQEKTETKKKSSMSFFTALSLSFNNLLTKKVRTFMVSFAGSIGIIGIALILSVSTGVQTYIDRVQQDTLTSYPITLEAESVDMSAMITTFMETNNPDGKPSHELDKVYANPVIEELMTSLNNMETNTNNLTDFKAHLESDTAFESYTSAVQYAYDLNLNIYTKNDKGEIVKSDVNELMNSMMTGNTGTENTQQSPLMDNAETMRNQMMDGNRFNVWEELLPNNTGKGVNPILKDQYDLVYGEWPKDYNEIVLIVDKRNEISDLVLYALGLRSKEQMMAAANGETETADQAKNESWSYEEICDMRFKLILPADCYQKQKDGSYVDLRATDTGISYLYNNTDTATELKISGIIRANEDAVASMLEGSIGYTVALTDYIIEKTAEKEIVKEQLAQPETDVLTGLPYQTEDGEQLTDEQKQEKFKSYIASLSSAQKASLYTSIASLPEETYIQQAVTAQLSNMGREDMEQMLIKGMSEQMSVDSETVESYVNKMSDEELQDAATEILREAVKAQYAAETAAKLGALTTDQLAAMLDSAVFTTAQYARYYDNFMPATTSDSTLEERLETIGYVDKNQPAQIHIYASTFEDKEAIADLITKYNDGVEEADKISYTDYVELMMSSVSTIINAISYVLIAFVAISLVVSSIMIGIITYISVLERTKEIGILRAIGASKKDISRVFNAETLIVGFVAGAIGIGTTLLLNIPINLILHKLTGIEILSAKLPVGGALILVGISMLLTFIAGLIPSGIAAKKDPVIALRSE
ncbi:MAG: ABC transporter ATP-binding protein/permease [Clostridia bacterium]|nr:ABC transporter ATP-binding protein/permease [Clostridia bacterium]